MRGSNSPCVRDQTNSDENELFSCIMQTIALMMLRQAEERKNRILPNPNNKVTEIKAKVKKRTSSILMIAGSSNLKQI